MKKWFLYIHAGNLHPHSMGNKASGHIVWSRLKLVQQLEQHSLMRILMLSDSLKNQEVNPVRTADILNHSAKTPATRKIIKLAIGQQFDIFKVKNEADSFFETWKQFYAIRLN